MSSDASSPSDGLGDGTATTSTSIDVVVDQLSLKEAVEYRRELILAICNPGIEYDMTGPQKDIDETAYKAQLILVENKIKSYGDLI